MRILMFGMSSYPGGIENYIANYFLCEEFSGNITIDFVTYEDSLAYSEKIQKYGHTIQFVPHLKKNPIGYLSAVNQLLKANAYDCVYLNMLSAANILPIYCAVRHGISKIVVHAHANSTVKGFIRKVLHKLNRKYCSKYAHYRLACSRDAGNWLFDKSAFQVVPNAIDVARFSFNEENRKNIRSAYGLTKGAFLIGHVGRFAEEKNHDFLVDIFASFIEKRPESKLMLVGDGNYRERIEKKVEQLGLKEKVIFIGTSTETEKYYSAFDCFVFPSVFEGFGMAALEAQANGLKCFCSDTLSNELKVTSRLEFLSLESNPAYWTNKIFEETCDCYSRLSEEIPMDFDIVTQRKKMMEIFQ